MSAPCFSLLFIGILTSKLAQAAIIHRVNDGTVKDIFAHTVCEKVTNNSGLDIFIGTNTAPEWTAFRSFPPSGVVLSACNTIPPEDIIDLAYAGRTSATITLAWTEPYDNGTPIQDYYVEYKETSSGTWLLFADGLSTNAFTTVTGLSPSTSYDFRVSSYNGSTSSVSNVVTQSTAPNTSFFAAGVFNLMNCGGATRSSVVALDDNTSITLNGTPLAGSPINAGQILAFNSSLGGVLSADKPIYATGRLVGSGTGDQNAGNIEWNTPNWANRDFVTVGSRNAPHIITVYAFENTNITITRGATIHYNNDPVVAGNFRTYSVGTNAGYKITSTGLITAYQYSEDASGNTVIDNMPIIPPDLDIIGIPSQSGQYTTTVNGTAFTWYESDNTTGGTNLTEGVLSSYGGNGNQYQVPSARAISTVPIVGRSNADSDGSDSAPFVPKSFMKRRFANPHLAEWVAFASVHPATIQVFQTGGTHTTLTLTRTGTGTYTPYHGRLTAVPAGTIFESNVVFQAWYESDEASENSSEREDESLMVGDFGVDLPVNHKLLMWLDAKDTSTLFQNHDCTGAVTADGQNVGCWQDKSRQSAHSIQDGGNKPVYKAAVTGFGGRPGVDFDGGPNFLKFNSSILIGRPYTIFAVVHRDSTASNNYFIGTQSGSANEGLHLGFSSNTEVRLGQVSNDISATVADYADNSVGLFWGRLNTSSGKTVFFNNVSASHGTTTTIGGSGQGVIGRGYDTNGFDGQLAELIIYGRALNTTEIDNVKNYLLEKWLTPPLDTDLRLWLDASDTSRLFTTSACSLNVISSGNTVGCWKDRGGHNYVAKTLTGTPLWKSDGGRNIVEFTNDSLSIIGSPYGGVFPDAHVLDAVDIFAVLRSPNAGDSGYVFHHPAGAGLSVSIPNGGNAVLNLDVSGSGTLSTAWGGSTSNYYLWNLVSDQPGSYQAIYRDNTLLSSDTDASNITIGTEDFYLGGLSGTGNFQTMNLGALIIFKKRLTTDERHMIRAYLKNKWSL